jgi:hypothetical protein
MIVLLMQVAKRMDRLLSLPVYSTISTVIDFAPFTVAAVCPLRKIRYYFSMLSLFQVCIRLHSSTCSSFKGLIFDWLCPGVYHIGRRRSAGCD